MKSRHNLRASILAGITILWAFAGTALATLPADQDVEYSIREDPTDENSDVVLVAYLHLRAVSVVSSSIDWEVESAEFEEIDTNGNIAASWSITSPTVNTVNGLWSVSHVDTENPAAHEFDTPPLIEGSADYVSGTTADLDFSIGSGSLTQVEQAMFGGDVVGLSHSFQEVSASQPIVEGDDEPGEITGDNGGGQ